MGQALYRKYRPKKISEVVGQEHITTTLTHALKQGTISHAYLFTGPRGVGKTSVARILAHEINGLPYTDESTHLDIIEIDAASNRRIDEIRDLRDKVHITPTSAKYKVYIIDEVHMLTREAFNALLKTLEEPPAHAIFILATTEAHKLPETIISRTQRYTFKPVPIEKVIAHLLEIAEKEKVKIDDEALHLIAEAGDGSFRDSISLLDQIRNQAGTVSANDVRGVLGMAPNDAINQLIDMLGTNDSFGVVATLNRLEQQGFEAAMIAKQMGGQLREQLLNNHSILTPINTLDLLKELLEVPSSRDPKTILELILLTRTFNDTPAMPSPTLNKVAKEVPGFNPTTNVRDELKSKAADQTDSKAESQNVNEDLWPKVLDTVKRQHNTLYSVLRMATPQFDGSHLELGVAFAFHQKRLNEPKNKQIIADTIVKLSGKKFEINSLLTDKSISMPSKNSVKSNDDEHPVSNDLKTISNIFGGAELLES